MFWSTHSVYLIVVFLIITVNFIQVYTLVSLRYYVFMVANG